MKNVHLLNCLPVIAVMLTVPANAQIPGNLGVTDSTTVKTNTGTSNTVTSGNMESNRPATTLAPGTGTTISNTINSRANDSSGRASWDMENNYWQQHYSSRPYYDKARDYNNYAPAYRYGVDLYNQNSGVPYSSLSQEQLKTGWNNARDKSQMDWSDVQIATQDAYNRLYESNNKGVPSAQ